MIGTNTIELQDLKNTIKQQHDEILNLKEQFEWFKRQIFGARSERIIPNKDSNHLEFPFFKDCEVLEQKEEPKAKVAEHHRTTRKQHGKDKLSFPDDLPVERTVIDIPEKEKVCSQTGQPLVKIGDEITRKLAYKPGSYYVKEIVRPKYAMPKGAEEGIRIADLPEAFIPKSRVDESFLADILTKKFADHLPLYRISEILSRENIYVSRQLLSQWVIRVGKQLKPLHDMMLKKILETGNVFIDETPIKQLSKGKGKTHQGYMWVLAVGTASDPPYYYFNFRQNRKHSNVTDLLGDYKGVLHSDKYGAYETLASRKQIIWCPCWAHVRRQFVDAETGSLDFREYVLRKIKYLFMFEKIAWSRTEEERLKIRQEKEVPIIDELIEAVKEELIKNNFPHKSKYRKALGYFISLIPYLKNYTKHAYARIDNNTAERVIRPLAIGRKNWLFFGNEQGGEAAAVIYTLVQTCRALKINPREYLEDIFKKVMSYNYSKLEELLPNNWQTHR